LATINLIIAAAGASPDVGGGCWGCGGWQSGGGLKVVQASADRPGKRVSAEGASILWIHTSIVILVRRAVLAAKALQLDRTIKADPGGMWMLAHAWE
jgi:hypothetical protein